MASVRRDRVHAIPDRIHGPAASALKRLTEQTRGTDAGWALGLEARSRALLSEGETADSSNLEAIARLRPPRLRPELARAHLLYGNGCAGRAAVSTHAPCGARILDAAS